MQPITDQAFFALMDQLEKFLVLSVPFKKVLRPMLFEAVYRQGSRILNFRQRQEYAWFMMEGLAREIRVNDQTFAEKTIWFWFPGSFLYTSPGFFSQEPSQTTIEVLQEVRVVLISYADWYQLKEQFRDAEMVTEKIRGWDLQQRVLHESAVKNLTTEELYLENRDLMNKLFGFTKRKFIAEFMGMSLDRLGRLRKKY